MCSSRRFLRDLISTQACKANYAKPMWTFARSLLWTQIGSMARLLGMTVSLLVLAPQPPGRLKTFKNWHELALLPYLQAVQITGNTGQIYDSIL